MLQMSNKEDCTFPENLVSLEPFCDTESRKYEL